MSERRRKARKRSPASSRRATTAGVTAPVGGGAATQDRRSSAGPLPPGLQKKAVVGQPGDQWEREADRAADRIVRGESVPSVSPVSAGALQRAATDEEPVQTAVADEEPVQTAVADEEPVQTAVADEEPVQTAVADEEPVQTAVADEEPVQTAVADEEPVQTAVADEEPVQTAVADEEPVQTKDGGNGSGVSVPRTGLGSPLPPRVRGPIESGLGMNMSGVRVHDGGASRAAADQLGAKAFTQGSNIHLGSGHSANDLGLMAHESTHVVQQSGGRGMVQRNGTGSNQTNTTGNQAAGTGVPDPTVKIASVAEGRYDATNPNRIEMVLNDLTVHPVKRGMSPRSDAFEPGRARTNLHRANWTTLSETALTEEKVRTELAKPEYAGAEDQDIYYLKTETGEVVVGDAAAITGAGRYPNWSEAGGTTRFDIDHRLEYQLGGEDVGSNLWLLDNSSNSSSGSTIAAALRAKMDLLLEHAGETVAGVPPNFRNLKNRNRSSTQEKWVLRIANFSGPDEDADFKSWDEDELRAVEPIKKLSPLNAAERAALGASPDDARIYFGDTGGRSALIENVAQQTPENWWFGEGPFQSQTDRESRGNVAIDSWELNPGVGGRLTGRRFRRQRNLVNPSETSINIPLLSPGGIANTYFMQGRSLADEFRKDLHFVPLSLIQWDDVQPDFEKGTVGRGRLMPSVPLIGQAAIDVVMEGDDIYLSKVFSTGDFSFPGPIEVTDSSLELQFGPERGFAIIGNAAFEIPNIGSGSISAEAGATAEDVRFAVEGEFNFLSDLFDPARISVWYREEEFGGRGELGIPEGTVNGLRSANVVAEWTGGVLTANGTFETELPGIDSGTMNFVYNEDGSFELGGTLQLSGDIPGIESGTVEASVSRDGDGAWGVVGEITAVPSIPGISSQISGRYENGIVTLRADAQYRRGMAEGSVTVGLTNQALDDAGNPTGDPTDELRSFGGGQVTLTLAPWLAATAGIALLPNGEIEVQGEIGLPDALEIFPERTLERNLFSVNLDIPIIGVAAAGQRIGIFATIGGGADLRAFFGPAQLRNLRLGVTWNPDRPDETTIDGNAQLHLPAGAGIRLNVNAGIGAGIPLVSATLGLEIGGELGVEAAVEANFDMNWTPTTGLLLEAEASAHAEPVFRFDITGFAKVELDLLFTTITLFEERWRLLEFEYGSGLRLGMTLPIRYQEGEPFEPSLDDVVFEVPDINPSELLTGLVSQIV